MMGEAFTFIAPSVPSPLARFRLGSHNQGYAGPRRLIQSNLIDAILTLPRYWTSVSLDSGIRVKLSVVSAVARPSGADLS
jgi:hypothetical protein